VDTAKSCFPHKCGALYMGYSMISSLWD
jgi:hypothetical protein